MPKQNGARPSDAGSHDVTPLRDLGISKMQSSRWQAIASLPEPEFEGHVEETKRSGKELTTASVLKMAKQRMAKATTEEEQPTHEDLGITKKQSFRWQSVASPPGKRHQR